MDILAREFEAFVRARTPALLRSAYLLTGDLQLAEDLVQTALARTHGAWRRLSDGSGNADAYVRRTMYHLQVSRWRRRRVAEYPLDRLPHDRDGGADDAQQAVVRLTLRAALLRLTPRQRAVLVLRFYEDLTEAETAALLGVVVGTVKSQTAKALARLRSLAPELSALNGASR